MLRAPRARATSSARAIMRAPIPLERKAAATCTLPTRARMAPCPVRDGMKVSWKVPTTRPLRSATKRALSRLSRIAAKAAS